MNKENLKINFWKKFSHYLLIGLSAIVLLAGVQSGMVGDFTQRGPDAVLADEDDCATDPTQLGCSNPGTIEDIIVPGCPDDHTYCHNNRLVHKHGGYWDGSICVYAYDDIGTCGAPPPVVPPPVPTPSCTDDHQYCDTDVNRLIHKHGGYWDGSKCVYAFDDIGACGVTPPPPAPPPAPIPPPPAPSSCPVNSACCSGSLQRCSANGYDASCPGGFRWCYAGFCVNENYNPATNNCTTAAPPPVAPPPVAPPPVAPPLVVYPPVVPPPFCPVTTRQAQNCAGIQLCTFSERVDCRGSVISRSSAFNCFNASQCGYRPPVAPPPPAGGPGPITINPGPITITNNNPTTVTQSNPQTVTVSVPQTTTTTREVVRNVGVGASGQPRVVTAQVQGVQVLPKTGLPALAWAALAFIPAGYKIRKFSKIKEEAASSPSFLWEQRQFKA